MANILIRDVPDDVVEMLKKRAKAHDHPLRREPHVLLEEIARQPGSDEIAQGAVQMRRTLAQGGRAFSDSAALQREDRSGARRR
jgi:plasmid stability protein